VLQKLTTQLDTCVRGQLIKPDSDEYDAARKVYNGMIDKYPNLIVRCADVADVIATVKYAKANNLLLSVRGGGHNGAGLGMCDGGVVIDLSPMKGIRVDPTSRTVRVEPGCTQGEVDHATHPFGLAVPSGTVACTGIAGLTLGGGHGYLTRKYGLTIDNLLEVDIVMADGRLVTANAENYADLFWAIRGGGGNFGIVTSFLFQAHPVSTVVAGPMLWRLDRATEVMEWYREFIVNAPEDIYGFFAFLNVPPGPPFPEHLHTQNMCGIIWCYSGELDKAEQTFTAIRDVVPPEFDHVGLMPYPQLQSMFDPLLPTGLQWYWKGDFVTQLSDKAIAQHIKHGSQLPTQLSTMHLYPIDGAANRVGRNDTAFSFREAKWSMVIAGIDPDSANAEKITTWAREYWRSLHQYSCGGAYVNFMMEEGQERIRATYRDNYDRLVAIKTEYDPTNLFRVNQNIRPI
jgi:FAD/FMN-containing dehydrogenase